LEVQENAAISVHVCSSNHVSSAKTADVSKTRSRAHNSMTLASKVIRHHQLEPLADRRQRVATLGCGWTHMVPGLPWLPHPDRQLGTPYQCCCKINDGKVRHPRAIEANTLKVRHPRVIEANTLSMVQTHLWRAPKRCQKPRRPCLHQRARVSCPAIVVARGMPRGEEHCTFTNVPGCPAQS
jgi:hypothetical protein